MSEGRVDIDFNLNVDKAKSDTDKVKEIISAVGEGAGEKLDENFGKNTGKMVETARKAHDQTQNIFSKEIEQKITGNDSGLSEAAKDAKSKIAEVPKSTETKLNADSRQLSETTNEAKSKLKGIPEEIRSKLIADARTAGISNFIKIIDKIPSRRQTELITKAESSEAINYEDLLKKVPTRLVTQLTLNDNASANLVNIKERADETSARFDHLKQTLLGTFAGNLIYNGMYALGGAFSSLVSQAAESSDAIQKFQDTMKFGGFGEKEIKTASKEMKKYADQTVYDNQTVFTTAAQLAANGVKGYQKLTEAAGNLNAAAGGTADTFNSVAMVITQTVGAGKLTTENWNQLANAIPGASGKLQEAMKKNGAYTGDFRTAMANGQISADEFNKAITQLGMNDGAKKAATSTSTFEGAFGNMQANIINGMNQVINAIGKDKMTKIVDQISNAAVAAMSAIAKLIVFISENISTIKAFGTVFISAFAAYKVVSGITTAIGAIKKLRLAILGFNVASSINPLGIIVAAVVALAAAFYEAYKHVKPFRDAVNTLWKTLKRTFTGKLGWEKTVVKEFNKIRADFSSFGKWITSKWKALWNGVKKVGITIWNGIKIAAKVAFTAIKIVALAPIVLLAALIVATWKKIEGPTKAVWNVIKVIVVGTAKAIWNGVKIAFNALKAVVIAIWNAIKAVTSAIWNPIKSFVIGVAKAIWHGVSSAFNALKGAISSIWHAISSITSAVWNPIKSFVIGVAGGIWHGAESAFNGMKNAISGILDAISSKWHDIWNGIKGFFGDIWKDIKGLAKSGVNGVIDFLNGGIKGIDKVIHFFGGSIHAINTIPKLATGTAPIIKPTEAIVNDQEGPVFREAILRNSGQVEIPHGRNVKTQLNTGDAVVPAAVTDLVFGGLPQYAGGAGDWLSKLWNGAKSAGSDILGSVKGMADAIVHPLQTLKNIFSKVTNSAKGIWNTMAGDAGNFLANSAVGWFKKELKKLQDEFGGSNPRGKGVQRWKPYILAAFQQLGYQATAGKVEKLLRQIATESGGNPTVTQKVHDINSEKGHPAVGLLQFIPSTFRHWAVSGHKNISSGYDQILAAINALQHGGEGGWSNIGRGHGWAFGGRVDQESIGSVAEGDNTEFVVPNPSVAGVDRSYAVLGQAAAYLGAKGAVSNVGISLSDLTSAVKSAFSSLGDIKQTFNLDGKTIAKNQYPIIKGLQASEINTVNTNTAIPVGGGH